MDGQIKWARGMWIILALTAASIEPIMIKLGYQKGASTWQLLAYRNLFAALAMILVSTVVNGFRGNLWGWIDRQDALRVVPAALLLMTTNGLVIFALSRVSTLLAVTVMTTTPAFVALANQLRGRVELGRRFWIGFAFCFVGVLLSIEAFHPKGWSTKIPLEACLGLGVAVVSSTIYRTKMDNLTQLVKPYHVSIYIFLTNAVVVSLFILPWNAPIDYGVLPVVAWTGCAAALANFAFLSAIRVIGSTRMSIIDMLQRPLVILCAALFLGESLSWQQGIGVVFVLWGIQWAKVRGKKMPPSNSSAPVLTSQPSRV